MARHLERAVGEGSQFLISVGCIFCLHIFDGIPARSLYDRLYHRNRTNRSNIAIKRKKLVAGNLGFY